MSSYLLPVVAIVVWVGVRLLLGRRAERSGIPLQRDAVIVRPAASLRYTSILLPQLLPAVVVAKWIAGKSLDLGVVVFVLLLWLVTSLGLWAIGYMRRLTLSPDGVEYVLGVWKWRYDWNDIERIEGFPTGMEPLRFRFTARSGRKFDAESTMEGWPELLDRMPRLLPERLKTTLSAHGS